MSTFDEHGILIDTYQDVFDRIIAALKSEFGDNIRTDPQSAFGSITAIFSEAIADQNEQIEEIVAAFQPANARGVFLSQLVRLNNITRNEQIYSQVTLSVTANTAGSTIPAGSLVSDPTTGAQFATDALIVVPPSGTQPVSASAVEAGPVTAEIGTLTRIDTPVFGWASVTNAVAAIAGRVEETDTELRARRELAASRVASTGVRAIWAAINDVQEVSDVYVHDNKGQSVDVYGVQPGAIWSIVEDGQNADIAEAIYEHLPAGHGTHGAVEVIHYDDVTGQNNSIKFSRPTERPVYITMKLKKTADYPGNGDAIIKQALVDFGTESLKLGVDVGYSRLFCPINQAEGHTVTWLYIGFAPSPSGTSDLTIRIYEKATIAAVNITITS